MNKISSASALVLLSVLAGCSSNDQSSLPVKVTPVAVGDEDIIPINVRAESTTSTELNESIDKASAATNLVESDSVVSVDDTKILDADTPDLEVSSLEGTDAITMSYETTHPTPKGVTEMTTTFTLSEENTILSVELIGDPAHGTSLRYHAQYQAGLNNLIVGQSVSEVNEAPGKINGSSLTSIGFNQALERLKSEA